MAPLSRSLHRARTPPSARPDTPEPSVPAQPALDTLFRQIAGDMCADAVSLGIDTGHGYRFAHYRADDTLPDNLTSIVLTPPQGYRIHSRSLSIGSPRRRQAPRSHIALVRTPGRPAFNRSAHQYLGVLLPHLIHLIELAQELESTRRHEACTRALLEHAGCGCMIVAADGTILHHNTQAGALLEGAGGTLARTLTLPGFGLQQRYADARARLVREAADTPFIIDFPTSPPLRMRLQQIDGARGLLAITIDAAPSSQVDLSHTFRTRYGLTPYEFRLCQALATGLTLKQCACLWNRSYETLRAQLKSIFSKTGCHRQLALTLLLREHTLR